MIRHSPCRREAFTFLRSSWPMKRSRLFSAHRPVFLPSPEAIAEGISDLNLWYLENAPELYFQRVQGQYTIRKDPTVGAFERKLWEVAGKKGYMLSLTEPPPPWRKELGGDHAVLTAVGVEDLTEDQKFQLERDYGAKGGGAVVPQEVKAVPPEVVEWIRGRK